MYNTHLQRDVNISQILQSPVHNLLNIILTQKLGNSLNFLKLTILVGDQTILGEVVRENFGNTVSKLFLLFGQIGSTDDAHGDFGGEFLHEGHHVWRYLATGDGEGAIDVEEGDDTRVGGCHFCFFGRGFVGHCEVFGVGVVVVFVSVSSAGAA